MKKISFAKPDRDEIVDRIQRYFIAELDHEIGALEAEMLLAFFAERIGPFYYNEGLRDAQVVVAKSVDDINERIYDLEQHEARGR